MSKEPEFCPLCGAHEMEWGQGNFLDSEIISWESRIRQIYLKLMKLMEELENDNL